MSRSRTVRTRPRNGLAITDVLTAALLSEFCAPSPELWLVTGWVTDMPVLDNAHRQYDAVLGDDARSSLTLTEVLGALTRRGSHVHVAVREVDHNRRFVERLRAAAEPTALSAYSSPDLHEKMLVGWTWLMKGSMNFTWSGLQRNEESIDFELDVTAAATQRLELQTRWRGDAP
ncbi:hypothetical protein Kfla_0823 [Kribbella flavida DSM 17836]|uniref:Phospholipase D-like domain-containing protein n=1 Tax=Kribbella flavida (strain DSM 17836 / JCM 10339 / NBRC 14399) TaxID=479435 RepID=D2PYU0_KRIFD|nr:phospholipase D-like domain-containing protein DpdK [Kribbella flavida]ADB29936.1 hypothetical protein Kfla_0823 [Kribbella flavida DSM 17836]